MNAHILLSVISVLSLILPLAGCAGSSEPEPIDWPTRLRMLRDADERRLVELERRLRREGFDSEGGEKWTDEERRLITVARQLFEQSGQPSRQTTLLFRVERQEARLFVVVAWTDREEVGGVRLGNNSGFTHVEIPEDGRPATILPKV